MLCQVTLGASWRWDAQPRHPGRVSQVAGPGPPQRCSEKRLLKVLQTWQSWELWFELPRKDGQQMSPVPPAGL